MDAIKQEIEGRRTADPIVKRAGELAGEGRYADAADYLSAKSTALGDRKQAILQRMEFDISKAMMLVDQGRFNEAISSLETAKKTAGDDLEVLQQKDGQTGSPAETAEITAKIKTYLESIQGSIEALKKYIEASNTGDLSAVMKVLKEKSKELASIGMVS